MAPSLRFFFIGGEKGNPQYANDCRAVIAREHLEDRIVMCGYRKDVFAWYRAADVLLLGSEREGLPRCIVEALAFGLPVVAGDIPGVRDLVIDGENGLVVPNDGFEQFQAALLHLGRDGGLRHRMGARGRALAEAKFRLETCAASFEQILAELIPSPHAA